MTAPSARYVNRELSWLEFNQRVLDEAADASVPLLERLKFLAITASNLDEFFMVRVGGLQELAREGVTKTDPAGMTPEEQLRAISDRAHRMSVAQYRCYLEELEPALAAAGITRLRPERFSERQMASLEQVFEDEISSVLTPMAVSNDPETFPLLPNAMLSACIRLEPEAGSTEPRFALIPFGEAIGRFVTLPSEGGYEYALLEDVVRTFADRFFPGEPVVECVPFRITRNADLSVREDSAADLLSQMQEVLDARKEGACVRLEVADGVTSTTLAFLRDVLDVRDPNVYAVPGPLSLGDFFQIVELKGFGELRAESWPPCASPQVDLTTSIFDDVTRHSVLLHHPYESFEPVLRLVEEAADDPDVLAIKQTLYRTSRNSPIVAALARAARNGKHVTALVELKARFDEARNIGWARNLEQEGVQVVYGVKDLKTHAKVLLVVRREPHGIQRYLHFGTGNYNESTARLYTDVSYMTCDEQLGADASSFFNAVAGYSQPQDFREIEVAPLGLRDRLLELIDAETERKRHGQEARIVAKFNSLVDPRLIEALYRASEAGVPVKLNVRGICCLRPGVPGLSENVEVVSIVDRFLEHSRIFYFHHGGQERVFISSADWMPRNLDRRVELMVPVDDPKCRRRLVRILETNLADTAKARRLLPDGGYERITPKAGDEPLRSQRALYDAACEEVRRAEQSQRTTFEPHRREE